MSKNNLVDSPIRASAIAKDDSAATRNYRRQEDKYRLTTMEKAPPCNVILPKTSKISPSVQGQLSLSNKVSHKAKNSIVLPELKSSSLMSLGKLCDDNCQVLLEKINLKSTKTIKWC